MSPSLTALEAIYFQAQTHLNAMLAACKTETERNQIRSDYVKTRQNYFACVNRSFHDDDPALVDLVAQAEASAAQIRKSAEHLGNIAKVIDAMTASVKIGAKIAAMAV